MSLRGAQRRSNLNPKEERLLRCARNDGCAGTHDLQRDWPMIDYKVGKHLRILFVGINPHPGSYRRGVPFSNNKTFWYLLNRAGLLHEDENVLRTDRGIKEMFDTRFLSKYRLGFINLVDRPTVEVIELKKGEEKVGVKRAT